MNIQLCIILFRRANMDFNNFYLRDWHYQRLFAIRDVRGHYVKTYEERVDPVEKWGHNERRFRQYYRLSFASVDRLVDLLDLDDRLNDRGKPVLPRSQACIFLNHMAGGHFQGSTAYCHFVGRSTAHRVIYRVRDRLLQHRDTFIRMPTAEERDATAAWIERKFHIPGIAYGVDGMLARLEDVPRDLPVGPGLPNKQNFWTRKSCPAINCLVLGDHKGRILDIDADWHGAAHDATIWTYSNMRRVIEENRVHLVAGDSAFPISDTLVKPFSTDEAQRDPVKKLWNLRLSGARTILTEHIYGRWKRRWPILNRGREHYPQECKNNLRMPLLNCNHKLDTGL